MRFTALCCLASLLVGCAGVSFKDDSKDSSSGLRIYPPKTYVMVTRTGNKEKPAEVRVVTLPDLSHPQRMDYHGGLGSFAFNFKLADGVLSEWNQNADSKVPETIKEISGLLGTLTGTAEKSVGVVKGFSALGDGGKGEGESPAIDRCRVSIRKDIAPWVGAAWAEEDGAPADKNYMLGAATQVAGVLFLLGEKDKDAGPRLKHEMIADAMDTAAGYMLTLVTKDTKKEEIASNFNTELHKRCTLLKGLAASIRQPSDPRPTVELYEIVCIGDKFTLVLVGKTE